MEKFFEVRKGCNLYNDYFQYLVDSKKMNEAFKEVAEEFEIESHEYYPFNDNLEILPTLKDREKFGKDFKKNSVGRFKKASLPSKRWVELVKDLKHARKPLLFNYMSIYGKWSERLFHIGDKVYASFNYGYDTDWELPEFAIPMKASEFYKIIEDNE